MPHCPKNTRNVAASHTDAPSWVAGCIFIREIIKKPALPGEAPMRRPGNPIWGGTHQERNLISYLPTRHDDEPPEFSIISGVLVFQYALRRVLLQPLLRVYPVRS